MKRIRLSKISEGVYTLPESVKAFKFHVFISYAAVDGQDLAEYLKNTLERSDIPVFVASCDIPIGKSFVEAIDSQIKDCTHFVAILTPAACESDYVRSELSIARLEGKKIIPCVYEAVDRRDISDVIKNLQYLSFRNKEELAGMLLTELSIEMPIQMPILEDVRETGIVRIFQRRRFNDDFDRELQTQISNSKEPILMMGNTLRDFFGWNAKYSEVIIESLRNGLSFKVLLLDPTSEAAKERAIVEHGELVKYDRGYITSELFSDIKRVMMWLYHPPSVRDDLRKLINNQIEVRFYTTTPTAFVIKTDNFTFVEQYIMGIPSVRNIEIGHECIGGYVPLLMVENYSDFAKIVTSHFYNIWDKMNNNTLEKIYGRVSDLEQNPEE